jgi:hypothetical protein
LDNDIVTGLDALNATLKQFGERAFAEAGILLEARGETIMGDSKQNYVPVDQSTLQGTGHVEKAVVSGENVSVRLAYGGPGAAYAQAIHEHLSEHSPRSWKAAEASGRGVHFTQGGPKYLELPFIKGTANLAQWIADGLKRRLGT